MVKIGKKEKNDQLYKAILMLKDEQECYEFFQDLCTVSELRAMEQRFEVASLRSWSAPGRPAPRSAGSTALSATAPARMKSCLPG